MRAQRWMFRALLALGALLALVAAFAAFVVFTPAGADLALRAANGRDLPVRAAGIDGALWRRFTLRGVELRTGPLEATADTVVVAWNPLALRAHRIELREVQVAGAQVVVRESADADTAAAETPADTAASSWTIHADRVRVRRASLDAPGGVHARDVDLAAEGGPEGYRATLRAAGTVPRAGGVRVYARVAGNTEAVTADSLDVRALGGRVHGNAFVRWSPGLTWRASLAGDSLRAGELTGQPDEFPGAIAFRARGTGRLDGDTLRAGVDLASLDGTLRGRRVSARGRVDVEGPRIAASDVRVQWGRASATLSGSMAGVADVTLDADIPSLAELLPRARGAARVKGRIAGTPERIEVDVTATARGIRVAGRDLPALDAVVDATLDAAEYRPHAATVRRASVRTGVGYVEATGTASWRDGTAWDVALDVRDFETSTFAPARWNLRGPVSARATTAGTRRGRTMRANLDLASLSGTLRERPLSGSGKIAVRNRDADVSNLNITWGDLRASANGHAGEILDLDLDLSAPDLSVLDAAWRGAVAVKGHARGPRRRSAIAATIAADSVRVRDLGVDHLDGHANADLDFASPADVALVALGVRRGESVIDTVRVDVTGPRDDHHVVVLVAQAGARGEIALTGAWADSTWSGWIDAVDVYHRAVGRCRSEGRAPLFLSAARAQLDSLAVRSRHARVSVDGAWEKRGELRARVGISGESRRAATRVQVHEHVSEAADVRVGYDGEVLVNGDRDGLGATVDIELTQEGRRIATARGNVSVPGFVVGRDSPGDQLIEGRVDVECADIGPILGVLSPGIARPAGALTARAVPRGTLRDFRIEGNIALENARADLPNGLRLRDAHVQLASDGAGNVSLDGRVTSGGGRVVITAVSARSQKGFVNGTFTARGERFQVVQTPEAQVFVSPDVEVKLAQSTAAITGTVRVPCARIEVAQVPSSAVAASPDVVIVEDTLATRPTVQVTTSLRVVLGDSVTFNGFGLRARLAGSLQVDDERGRPTRGTGEIQIVEGKYRAFGSELTIDPGRLVFGGGPIDNPGLDVRAYRYLSTSSQSVVAGSGDIAGINLRGSLAKPSFTVFSNPPMSEGEIITSLLTGRKPEAGAEGEQSALSSAAMMIGMQQGTALAGDIGKKLALDEAYLESGANAREASFVAGKYLSPKLYVSYAAGLFENTNTFRVRYSLSNRWTLQTESGTKASGTDILYWFERGK